MNSFPTTNPIRYNIFTESKNKRIQVNESITFIGQDNIYSEIVETDSSYTLLFILTKVPSDEAKMPCGRKLGGTTICAFFELL